MIQDEWKQFEVEVCREGNLKFEDGKLVMEWTIGYLPLDQADCYEREQDAMRHFMKANEVLIELDRIKQYTENGIELKVEFDLHGLSWGWKGTQKRNTRYETKKENI